MCGIVGIWNFDGQPVPQRTIDRFTDSLAHRGPDGRGVWKDDRCGIALGHRRLAILDLSEDGKQPMSYIDSRYIITYNGEVYNFLELREELEAKGYLFRSQTDTEVILAAFHEWGSDMLLRFNGMWAMAIYDTQQQELFLTRDRFGIKPLYYVLTPRQFSFASELKAFMRLDDFQPQIDTATAQVLLQNVFGVEGTTRTLLQGVKRLPGGHYAIIKGGQIIIRRWWKTLDHLVSVPSKLENQATHFRELFYDAVKIRMRSDVPIGTCLSGGFDSSAVACAMSEISRNGGANQRQAGDWQQAFIATFPGAFNDERAQAEEVVKFAGVKPHFLAMTSSDPLEEIEKILYDSDDVYSGIPTSVWLIYRELRRNKVVVSLDGHGADELMGGYAQPYFLLFQDAPSWLRSPLKNICLIKQYYSLLPAIFPEGMRPKGWLQTGKEIARAQLINHPQLGWIYRMLKRIRKLAGLERKRNPFLRTEHGQSGFEFEMFGKNDVLPEEWGPVNRELYVLFHSTVLPTILRNFDRMSMAHGVEVRMPFMDWRLVRFVFSLPDTSKIGGGLSKRVAREAMKGKIPESIRTSILKMGFNSPMPEWFNGPLRSWMLNIAESEEILKHNLISGEKFLAFLRKHTDNHSWNWQNVGLAWQYLHYLWFEKFVSKGTA